MICCGNATEGKTMGLRGADDGTIDMSGFDSDAVRFWLEAIYRGEHAALATLISPTTIATGTSPTTIATGTSPTTISTGASPTTIATGTSTAPVVSNAASPSPNSANNCGPVVFDPVSVKAVLASGESAGPWKSMGFWLQVMSVSHAMQTIPTFKFAEAAAAESITLLNFPSAIGSPFADGDGPLARALDKFIEANPTSIRNMIRAAHPRPTPIPKLATTPSAIALPDDPK